METGKQQNTTLDMTQTYVIDGRKVYRTCYYLRFKIASKTGAIGSDGIVIDANASQFDVYFDDYRPTSEKSKKHPKDRKRHESSYPIGPRIRIAEINEVINDKTPLLNVWQEVGEQTQAPVYSLSDDKQKKTFFEQLQRICNEFFSGNAHEREGDIFLPIVFESDSKASLHINVINISYYLLRNHFDNIIKKTYLKFSGASREEKLLSLTLPLNSKIKKAQLELNADFKTILNLQQGDKFNSKLTKSIGWQVKPGQAVIKKITLPKAMNVDIISLALMPQSENIILSVQLLDGAGNGVELAKGKTNISSPDKQQWHVIHIDKNIVLDAKDYWISVCSEEGEFIWLGEHSDSVEPLYHLGNLQTPSTAGYSSNNKALQIKAGEYSAVFVKSKGPKLQYEFTTGLEQLIKHNEKTMHLSIVSASRGGVTVYSPEVIYEL